MGDYDNVGSRDTFELRTSNAGSLDHWGRWQICTGFEGDGGVGSCIAGDR